MSVKMTLHLSSATHANLRAMAHELGVPTARLARWIVDEGLRARLEAQFFACQDKREWAEMRVLALSNTGRFEECVALADDVKNPTVQRYASICRAQRGKQ